MSNHALLIGSSEYVDKILSSLFDIFFYCCKVKSLCIVDIFSTTYLLRLVNVVKECPLREKGKKFDNFSTLVLQLMLRCTEYMNARLEYVTIA